MQTCGNARVQLNIVSFGVLYSGFPLSKAVTMRRIVRPVYSQAFSHHQANQHPPIFTFTVSAPPSFAVSAPTNAPKLLLHAHLFAFESAFATLVPAVRITVSLLLPGLRKIVRTRARSASQYHHGFRSACRSCHPRPLSDQVGRIVIRLFVSVRTKSSVNRSSEHRLLQPIFQTKCICRNIHKTPHSLKTQQYSPSTLVAP